MTEEALVRAAMAGDREAFGMLYTRFSRAVHGTLLVRMPPAEAEDAVQDVFLQAMKRLSDIRDPATFGGWICSIARRRAVDHFRRGVRHEELPEHVQARADSSLRAQAAEALAAILSLPEAYHETLVLRLVEGMSGAEIASITGLTPESVRVNLHRGFVLLREKLGIGA
ncbi:MAG TPA: sigma-70 family RNA polymerase sigma factor [Thermoanaerobaculia bacterium]|nr:sigma-70 family RNA polymerase sigma factor [Thermoanaerobaculia bacterium]